MIKTILFDLDGTLLNTIDDLADAANWVCTQHGWPTFPVETYKHFVGNGIPKLVERFSPAEARTPERLAATLAEFSARYDAHKEDKTAPYPGIPELLAALKAEGIQTAVFSNKADAFCGKIIEHYFGPGLSLIHIDVYKRQDMNSSLALNFTTCSSRIIWPVDEMGSHSVMPSTMPIKIALMISRNI